MKRKFLMHICTASAIGFGVSLPIALVTAFTVGMIDISTALKPYRQKLLISMWGAAGTASTALLVGMVATKAINKQEEDTETSPLQLAANPSPDNLEKLRNYLKNNTCKGCRNWHGQFHGGNLLVCAIHAYGPEDKNCRDWESERPNIMSD